ncbi:MAG TPA: hypothetical protein VNL98_03250 [Gemmatimonadales bacterium]|nr:hypothetical protein [Gemmatimonadales bacterium]
MNRTPYDTRALRRIAVTVHRVMARHEGRLRSWRSLRVLVQTRRPRLFDNAVSGYATYDGSRIVLCLPHPKHGPLAAARVARLVEHELYHCYGYRHGRFTEQPAEWWAQHVGQENVPLRQVQARPVRDLVGERRAKAERYLRQWERRLKLAQTKVKQYRRRVRYYERARPILAAAEGQV